MAQSQKVSVAERFGVLLERALADDAIVLHDLWVPGARASIDHVVVAPSGVWVVDSTWRSELRVGAGDDAPPVELIERHVEVVTNAINGRARSVPIHAALCFPHAHWDCVPYAFWIDGVLVTYPADLVERVRAAGPLDEDTVGWIAARLALG
jgi:Nuclease-related domain